MTETPEISFEEALKQLEKIVSELESGQAPLEKSLDLYKKGAELKALCEARLEAARLQVEKISLNKAGVPEGVVPASFE
ncbi:exodeoxyribonuclease VII, small subunit [Asticcacaulis biprosthecium C19]|uniref:Exodeoxyribonuclease 7 small subunit n=1 Tax=Asticcacaulis biprosthecium C19 TaxID=715226 RepID=F4QTY9_9CAUL|nr:exodeoxyribonuclease VII small subunit [Asticcacaulis biprosthecium]EGF89289.1 exodeoxyribonuclease VII, small subunit [Asticcacaulis biprosthecium C19]